jgi:hypothetical protein
MDKDKSNSDAQAMDGLLRLMESSKTRSDSSSMSSSTGGGAPQTARPSGKAVGIGGSGSTYLPKNISGDENSGDKSATGASEAVFPSCTELFADMWTCASPGERKASFAHVDCIGISFYYKILHVICIFVCIIVGIA